MACTFNLPKRFKDQGWKLKIRDRERVEPPHVSLIHGIRTWRFCLRNGAFLDKVPPPRDVPAEVVHELVRRLDEFTVVWDRLYPENPVSSGGDT